MMVEDGDIRAALHCVQPLCVELVQSPNVKCVQKITEETKLQDPGVVQELQHFLIFPLRTTMVQCFAKTLPEQLLIECCKCLDLVLQKSELRNPNLFLDLFTILTDLMFSNSLTPAAPKQLSEEEKTAVVTVLCSLIASTQLEVLHDLYVPTNVARLGSVVSQLVSVVSDTQNSRVLRLQAMDTLLTLMQKGTYRQAGSEWQHGNRFASLLPGISTAMFKVLIGDSKQGHQLFCKALDVWTEVVCLTLGDEALQQEQAAGHQWIDELKIEGRLKELIARRNDKWLESVLPRVELMMKEMVRLKKHDSWKVRRQMVTWADRLLSLCPSSLKSCVSIVLEVLVLLMTDSYHQVAAPATAALEKYRDSPSNSSGRRHLVEILKENLYALVTSLPRRIQMEDEEEKKAVVGLFHGYISLLGQDMTSLLLSLPHLSRLVRVLVQVLELDLSDQKILEESGMGAGNSPSLSKFVQRVNVMTPRKVFLHFRDYAVQTGLTKACRLLGYHGDISILVESVMDVYRESAAHQLTCVLIINEILAGHGEKRATLEGASVSACGTEEVVRMVLEEYLCYDNMTLTDNKGSSSLLPLSPSSLLLSLTHQDHALVYKHTALPHNRAIMLTCLFLEGVSVCAKVLGQGFRWLLMDVLYPVSEKMGSEVSAISSTAYLTLLSIADACCYANVNELIQSNADYLVNSISLRLRHFERHPTAPTVLSVMLQLCSTNILTLVWDSIVEILDSLDEHHADQAATFVPVLYHLTLAVARWFPPQNVSASSSEDNVRVKSVHIKPNPAELVKLLEDRRRLRLESEAFDKAAEEEGVETLQQEAEMAQAQEEEEGAGEKEKEIPLHVKAVKEVLVRVKHMVSSSNPRLALLALDVMAQGCCDLVHHQNELLPLVHQMWPSFKQRFYDTDKVLVMKAVKTLCILCGCCGDFVRHRVEKDVLPAFRSYLQKQAVNSEKSGSSYQLTVNYKLQLTMLSSVGHLACTMGLDGAVLEQLVRCCLPYLSQRQPAKLQQACVESIKQLMVCDADIVWLALNQLHTLPLPDPPSSPFKPVTIFKHVGERNEFSTNVTTLLEELQR